MKTCVMSLHATFLRFLEDHFYTADNPLIALKATKVNDRLQSKPIGYTHAPYVVISYFNHLGHNIKILNKKMS